ncbi:hypothetical protein F511_05528 [Dorcoceras hygrometricum]|uniref:Uncharacterized protein n=1 Tax=Dorcoceras hygrometricum TaxID=472368 RepID=A0A2Z7AVV7_9LAMI|nr:hypothetical protein F511_05528 [Dorcoceras hygrometricum]
MAAHRRPDSVLTLRAPCAQCVRTGAATCAHSSRRCLAQTNFTMKLALQRLAVVVLRIRSMTEITIPLSICTRKHEKCFTDGISSSRRSEQVQPRQTAAHDGGRRREGEGGGRVEKGGEGAATLGFLE